jgi:DNA-binding response OmpR family regulator
VKSVKRVLVIDDQYQIRRLVRWAVEHVGFEMHEAANGEAGVALAFAIKPNLILLDVIMPGRFNGLDVCKILRSRPEFAGTWIVLLSANGSMEDRQKGREAGANAYSPNRSNPLTSAT